MMMNHPQIKPLIDSNPMMREIFSNPELMRQMFSPQMMQQMSTMLNSGGMGGMGMNPFGMGMPMTNPNNNNNNNSSGNMNPYANLFNMNMGNFGMGQNSNNNPQDNVDPKEKYKEQLAQLKDMGFINEEANIQVLKQCDGNVQFAIEKLLNMLK
jgi:ubiquilin